jgi:hypothetical protein
MSRGWARKNTLLSSTGKRTGCCLSFATHVIGLLLSLIPTSDTEEMYRIHPAIGRFFKAAIIAERGSLKKGGKSCKSREANHIIPCLVAAVFEL